MTTAIQELNEIIKLLEAQIPASQQSPKNQKLKGQLERKLSKYFRSLEAGFPFSKLAGIYNKYVDKER